MKILYFGFAAITAAATLTFGATPPVSASSITTGVIYGSGCGDSLQVSAIARDGSELAKRTLVKARQRVAFQPRGVGNKDKKFLFSSYHCDTGKSALYLQTVSERPKATRILSVPSDMRLLDATWDISRDRPVVLLADEDYNYWIQIRTGKGWKTLWSASRASMGGYFLDGIISETGREFIIWGDYLSDWKTWRLRSDSRLVEELSGPGRLYDISASILGAAAAYTGSEASWVCDGYTWGTIESALGTGECARIPIDGTFGRIVYGSAFTFAEKNDTYWLHLASLDANYMVKVTCPQGSLFSCEKPRVSDKRPTPLIEASGTMYTIYFNNLKAMKKLRPTRV